MDDGLLSPEDRMEALSRVYVRAVAARAGYDTATPEFDRDSIDLTIRAGGGVRPVLDLQLKATTLLGAPKDGAYRFRLKRKNYEDLRAETRIPRLLVVLALPEDEREWMTLTPDKLILRKCAYWLNLRGWEETGNRTSVTIPVPEGNLLTVEALRDLMELSARGRIG